MAARPPAPFSPQLSGDLRDQMRRIADALSRKADATTEPTYAAVLLLAPGGATYRLTVDDTGALATVAVAR